MGKIIKGGGAAPLEDMPTDRTNALPKSSRNVLKGSTVEARDEASRIIARAEQKAREMTDEAQAHADSLYNARHEEGFTKGYEEGMAKSSQEVQEALAVFASHTQELEAQYTSGLSQLALTIARKILGRELQFHPEAVVQIIRQALAEKARQRREIALRVHPDDLLQVREHKAELLEVLSRCKDIAIREDQEVERYGVIIETDAGTIDAQLETQLQAFENALKKVR